MNAMKNAAHLVILLCWTVAGALFTLKLLFGAGPAVVPVVAFWAWFAGLVAFTSFVVGQFKGPVAALGTHAGTLFVLTLLPKVLPFSLLRLGIDLLTGNS
ncbi:MAG: hypothetical protein AMXMBFR34_08610 [Myxococcaceae bacterium]